LPIAAVRLASSKLLLLLDYTCNCGLNSMSISGSVLS
jgi:hypothetical protein